MYSNKTLEQNIDKEAIVENDLSALLLDPRSHPSLVVTGGLHQAEMAYGIKH